MANQNELIEAIATLRKFMAPSQINFMVSQIRGEEHQFFIDKIKEMANLVNTMPKTYEQDGKGGEAVVYLHYFFRGMDWYIIERDMEVVQYQAFGYADLGHGAEAGYISIVELIQNGIELDLHFTPKTVNELKLREMA